MAELIGAAHPRFYTKSWKRHLLVFDRIAYPDVAEAMRVFTGQPMGDASVIADLQWLVDRGIVFDPQVGPMAVPSHAMPNVNRLLQKFETATGNVRALADRLEQDEIPPDTRRQLQREVHATHL